MANPATLRYVRDVAQPYATNHGIELGMDALTPHRSLVDHDTYNRTRSRPSSTPAGGSSSPAAPRGQQLPQQTGVAAVGLGPMLATTGPMGVGGLRQTRLEPRGLDLLHHVTPPGAALQRQRHRAAPRPASQVAAQPPPEPSPIGLPDPVPPLLARVDLGAWWRGGPVRS